MQNGESFSKLITIVLLVLALGSFFVLHSLFLTSVLFITSILAFLGLLPTYSHAIVNENVVIFRFGKYNSTATPGLFWYYPRFDSLIPVDMRVQVIDVPPLDYITKDSVVVNTDCIYYVKVTDAKTVLIKVKDYKTAITSIISTSLRNIIAGLSFEELNSNVEEINKKLKNSVDAISKDWGLIVEKVEIQKLIPPQSIIDAMNKRKEAEQKKLALEIQARSKSVNLEILNEVVSKLDDKTLTFLYLDTLKSMAEGRSNKIYFPAELTSIVDKVSNLVKQPRP